MAATDTLPIDPDYAVARAVQTGVIESLSDGGKLYRRIQRAPRRVFVLTWARRAKADFESLEQFQRKRQDDFFTFDDKEAVRKFSVFPSGELQSEQVGNEQYNIRWELIEAIGQPMLLYPTAPLGDNIASSAQTLSTGKLITYAGYGFTVTFGAGLTALLIDGVSQGAPASPYSNYTQALNLHRVELRPNSISITNFQAVI